jgi:hypothetical protein
MKTLITVCAMLVIILSTSGLALADGFYAVTNEIGYQGTIWNITQNTGPWTTSTPRDASLYTVVDAPVVWSNYSALLSNWYEHSTSNQNNSFLQIAEDGNASVTSASGGWDPTLKVFTVAVSGANATYESSYARFWQPDNGVAWGVKFTDYSYNFTATFADPAVPDSGGYTNASAPETIVGSFTGHFVVTDDINKNPITNGDTYGFDISFSKAMFAPLDALNADGQPTSVYNSFGTVPEPGTLTLLGLAGLTTIAATLIRRRKQKSW